MKRQNILETSCPFTMRFISSLKIGFSSKVQQFFVYQSRVLFYLPFDITSMKNIRLKVNVKLQILMYKFAMIKINLLIDINQQILFDDFMKQQIDNANSATTFSEKWGMLVKNIIKPPVKKYAEEDLGQQRFALKGRHFNRQDHQLKHKDKKISLTIYSSSDIKKYAVLYLHSNASNKLQSIQLLTYLPQNYNLACFDFIGCGVNSIQTPISLGIRESQQTKTVVEYLQKEGYSVAIWGRSMGGATGLLYGRTRIIVADSPFLSFKSVCKQISSRYSPTALKPFFLCLFCCIFYKLRSDIMREGKYDPQQLDIKKAVSKIDQSTVLVFLAADRDEVVSQQNSRILYKEFKGRGKYLQLFQGSHNSKRPKYVIQKVMNIIQSTLQRQDIETSIGQVQVEMQSTNSQRVRQFSKQLQQ